MRTPMKDVVLFLQNRPIRAGAQTSLARLVVDDAVRALSPVVLIGSEGWLNRWCRERDIPALLQAFPRSRSVPARLWGNARFARAVRQQLADHGWHPRVVVANDHQDGLLAQAIASACGARTVVILRTPGMSRRDFFKYACEQADLVYAVGAELQRAATNWLADRPVTLYREGLTEEEFLPPKEKTDQFPARVLVIGSEIARKGWADWVTALDRIEASWPDFRLDCDFTGPSPDPARNDLGLGVPRRSRFCFLGRVEGFRELVRDYDLVIHPSRHESFGLAPVEVLAAGVPLLCSRTGAIAEVQDDDHLLFEPGNVTELAAKLTALRAHWSDLDPRLEALQNRIRARFSLGGMAREFVGKLSELTA